MVMIATITAATMWPSAARITAVRAPVNKPIKALIMKVTALYLGGPVLSGQVLDLGGDVIPDLAGQGHQRRRERGAELQTQAGDLAIEVGVGANVLGADADAAIRRDRP